MSIALMMIQSCATAPQDSKQASSDIRQVLNQWPKDIDAGKADAVCDLFAKNVVLTFPGQPDRNYSQTCARLKKMIQNHAIRYDRPQIEEIHVEGNLAFVRLIWTLHERRPDGEYEKFREKGIDVFEHQNDGRWRIRVSYAFQMM